MTTHPSTVDEVVSNQDEGDHGDSSRNPAEPHVAAPMAGRAVTLEDRQKAYLLQQLLEVPGNSLQKGVANHKIGAPAKRDLQLNAKTANTIRDVLAQAGYIQAVTENRVERFTLKDEGREYLQKLPHDLFAAPRSKNAPPPRTESQVPPEPLIGYQQAYLLRLLANADNQKLTCSKLANKLATTVAKGTLGFEGTIAAQVMVPLIDDKCVEETGKRRTWDGLYPAPFASYRLTDKGEQRLFTMKQYPSAELPVEIAANVFNRFTEAYSRLLALQQGPPGGSVQPAFREAAPTVLEIAPERPHDIGAIEPAAAAVEPAQPIAAQLGDVILARFNELLREKYAHAGMVPIHEIRGWVAGQLGPDAADHKTFDAAVHELRKQNQIRFVTITDLRDGKPDQMEASIPGVNETFFYLEPAHEQSFNF